MKIEIRKDCKICGADLPFRSRTFCSTQCRTKSTNMRCRGYQKSWAQASRGKEAKNKIQCLICSRWYRQVGSHIVQKHEMTAREYRELFDLERKRGILPPDLRELKGEQALENGTWENLKIGKKFWFKKGVSNNYKRSKVTLERLKNLHKLK